MSAEADVTTLLRDWKAGNPEALKLLTPLVYGELQMLARRYLHGERADHTLQPTALINEAYVRLVNQQMPSFENRAHFFGVAAQLMRQILVDFGRKHWADKRGGHEGRVPLDSQEVGATSAIERFLALDEALERLGQIDLRKSQVIELKYFGGLSREEIAEHLGLTLATVKRDLSMGEAFLRRELSTGSLEPPHA